MNKWSLILNILFLTLAISSCVTPPDAPKLPHTPKQFIYADSPDKWCRIHEEKVVCVADLRSYGLYSLEDVAMMQIYITELNEKCEQWRIEDEF